MFNINFGVVSKKILEHKKFNFFNNLMHNQWQNRVSCLIDKDQHWIVLNKSTVINVLSKQIEDSLIEGVFPELQKHIDEHYIIENLKAYIKSVDFLPFNTAEDLLILTAKSFPERCEEMAALLRSKAKDTNDKLFIAELMRELDIRS